jgi:hypothetical protein
VSFFCLGDRLPEMETPAKSPDTRPVPVTAWEENGMRHIWIAALLVAPSQAADVVVFLNGDAIVPNPVSYPARSEVTRIFAGMGVGLVWQSEGAKVSSPSANCFAIHARFTTGVPQRSHPGALAYAEPFNGIPVITVMYDRLLLMGVGRPRLAPALLAHVLAHEIGHILLGTDSHAKAGIMKARWTSGDYDEMERKPMLFERSDEDNIRERMHLVELSILRK